MSVTTAVVPGSNFLATMAKFAETVKLRLAKVNEAISYELYDRVREKTPVDTGRAKNPWRLTVGTPSMYVPPKIGFPLAPAAETVKIDGTQPVYIVSNLHYVEYLENGTSKQAPQGMVAVTIAEVKSEMEAVIAKAIK